MANPSSTPPEVPPAHEGVHYDNPTSKSIRGPVAGTDRTGTQRLVWGLFFVLMLCVVATGVVLGLMERQP